MPENPEDKDKKHKKDKKDKKECIAQNRPKRTSKKMNPSYTTDF